MLMSEDSNQSPIRVLLVDDHFFVRMGLADSLGDEPSVDIVGKAASGSEAMDLFQEHRPDLVLLDFILPDSLGLDVLRQINATGIPCNVIMLTVNESEEDIYRCVESGAKGYLPKSIEREELIKAMHEVSAGKTYFPVEVQAKLDLRRERSSLTPREMETLQHLVGGLSNKEIASRMKISQATVKLHVSHIFEKLDVLDRTQAVTAAIQRGIVHLE